MKGLHLRSFPDELHKVPEEYAERPAETILDPIEKLGELYEPLCDRFDGDFCFLRDYYKLRLKAFVGFSFEELCMLKYTTRIMMPECVDKLFQTKARHELVRKIENSMWRWSGQGTWNEIADAYERIRHFSFVDNPDFEIRLDHTTYFNQCGYAKYSRIFLDGVFAFLVYYKRKHVLTIGFSILTGNRILIQQVQSAKRSGNRYLYQLPQNRLEFVIERFIANFPGYQLSVVDGSSLVQKTIADYQQALDSARKSRDQYQKWIQNPTDSSTELDTRMLRRSEENLLRIESKIAHLLADQQRLVSFYSNAGRFKLGPASQQVFRLIHYDVAA